MYENFHGPSLCHWLYEDASLEHETTINPFAAQETSLLTELHEVLIETVFN